MIVKSEAIVLKSMCYRDTSRIVTFYSEQFGKISGIAKGARDTKNKFGSSLQPMTKVSLVFYKKDNRDLHLISQCDTIQAYKNIHSSIDRMSVAMSMLELMNQVTHDEEKNQNLYSLLNDSFEVLERSCENFASVFYAYQLRLASLYGFAPSFGKCVGCRKSLETPKGFYAHSFHIEKGAFYCAHCGESQRVPTKLVNHFSGEERLLGPRERIQKISAESANLLRQLSIVPIESVVELTFSQVVGNELEECLRLYLQSHFEDLRPLRSSRVFKQII